MFRSAASSLLPAASVHLFTIVPITAIKAGGSVEPKVKIPFTVIFIKKEHSAASFATGASHAKGIQLAVVIVFSGHSLASLEMGASGAVLIAMSKFLQAVILPPRPPSPRLGRLGYAPRQFLVIGMLTVVTPPPRVACHSLSSANGSLCWHLPSSHGQAHLESEFPVRRRRTNRVRLVAHWYRACSGMRGFRQRVKIISVILRLRFT